MEMELGTTRMIRHLNTHRPTFPADYPLQSPGAARSTNNVLAGSPWISSFHTQQTPRRRRCRPACRALTGDQAAPNHSPHPIQASPVGLATGTTCYNQSLPNLERPTVRENRATGRPLLARRAVRAGGARAETPAGDGWRAGGRRPAGEAGNIAVAHVEVASTCQPKHRSPTSEPNRRAPVPVYRFGSTGNRRKLEEFKSQFKILVQSVQIGIPTGTTGISVRFDRKPVVEMKKSNQCRI
jgi:hypothetical protein